MKIAIFYHPRSRSTMTHHILAKKFNLTPWNEILTISRRTNQHYDEYPDLINKINTTDNVVLKICINDFINTKDCVILDAYKDIDYKSFDHIIFNIRSDVLGTMLSFGHHYLFDPSKWFRIKGQSFPTRSYEIELARVFYILRSYRMFDDIKEWVTSHAGNAKLHSYDYSTVKEQLKQEFDLDDNDFDINIVPNEIDYKSLATNYDFVADNIMSWYSEIMSATQADIDNPDSFFWKTNVNFI